MWFIVKWSSESQWRRKMPARWCAAESPQGEKNTPWKKLKFLGQLSTTLSRPGHSQLVTRVVMRLLIVTCAEYNRGKWAHYMYSMTRSIFHIFAYCFHHFYAPFGADTSNISETFIARRWHLCIQIGTRYKNCTSQAVKIISAQRNFIESLSQKVLCLGSGPEMWYIRNWRKGSVNITSLFLLYASLLQMGMWYSPQCFSSQVEFHISCRLFLT